MASLQIKRGTRNQLDTAATASGLKVGELYLITDEDRLAIGTAINSYQVVGKATDYATAAQGTLADTAVQPDNIGVTVQGYSANTVIDASYVHTDNNYTTTEKNKLASIEEGATADQTAAEILTAIKTVDGADSGLDADTVDGLESTAFATAAQGSKADALYYQSTDVKTSAYTAVSGDAVLCDTTGGAFTITLPASGTVKIVDYAGTSAATGFGVTGQQLTITPSGGSTIMGETSIDLDVGQTSYIFTLYGTDWKLFDIVTPWVEVTDWSDIVNKPTLGTAAATNSTDYATSAQGALADTALQSSALNNTALTGIPTAPTAAEGTNTTQIATTAFVLANSSPYGLSVAYHNTATLSPAVNTIYLIDTTTTAVTITLPDSPTDYSRVRICDYLGVFSTNNVTINRSGTNTIADGAFTDLTLSTNYAYVELTYYNGNWSITGGNSFVDQFTRALTELAQAVTYVESGTSSLDNGVYNVFALTADGIGTTIEHNSVPTSNRYAFELHLNWVSGTITWPASWTQGDTPPTAVGDYLLTGITIDGGSNFAITVVVK